MTVPGNGNRPQTIVPTVPEPVPLVNGSVVNGDVVSNAPEDRLRGWFFSVGLLLTPAVQTASQTD